MLSDTTATAKTVNSFKTGNGKEDEDGSVLGRKSAGPRGRHGHPERPSCEILQVSGGNSGEDPETDPEGLVGGDEWSPPGEKSGKRLTEFFA